MGCWNETCFITGGAIKAGDPVIMFIVQQSGNPGTVGESWMPVSLPIIGVYDDYGGVDKATMSFNKQFIDCWTSLFTSGELKISERGETMSKYEDIGPPFENLDQILHEIKQDYLEYNSNSTYLKENILSTALAHKDVYDFLITSYLSNQDKYNYFPDKKTMLERVMTAAELFSPDEDVETEAIFKKHGLFLEGIMLRDVCGMYVPRLMPHLVKQVLKTSSDHELLAGAMEELATLYRAMTELRRPMYTYGTGRGSQQDNTKLKSVLSQFEHSFFSERQRKDEEEYAECNESEEGEE